MKMLVVLLFPFHVQKRECSEKVLFTHHTEGIVVQLCVCVTACNVEVKMGLCLCV